MLYVGVEHLTSTTSDMIKYRIGAEGYWDRMTAGVSYSNWNTSSTLTFTTAYVEVLGTATMVSVKFCAGQKSCVFFGWFR
ncbi:MAG: hypothetical protein COB39_06615 [Marinosulfonomonas sp.]|nr:MAG: hypothetical protein COB39_06615 [Marinosulfonomonas sp.]